MIYSKDNMDCVMEREKEKVELSEKKQGKINLQIMITSIKIIYWIYTYIKLCKDINKSN